MDKLAKLLAAGVVCGLAIASLGLANTYRLEWKIEKLSAACVAEGERDRNTPDAPAWKRDIILLCDAETLAKDTTHIPPGIQGELVSARLALDSSRRWPFLLAMAIAGVLAVPWCWYFLLNRIRELREALIGK
jgi:hypothetical protein